ncbi:NAD-dependent epimerase/dehydratase family protein [Trichothermofontia sichuanensis B231]|uniref:NAD-dependent epimerase/dehydratase family protein n=1 Tax=Trichothermofontia sichuanensis TaxID=3045816 RepID=UPI0022464CA3|nr:NAD-dependent epimerase/dehydratase family protein [Trichothermofontia sichuanensis]UZQ54644.1 NAD-dependent epimerase/dehydratase family protein [Trichothermofontia sichuanensis B231]
MIQTALVTGANGFTGSHLVKALVREGATVVGWVRPTSNLARLRDVPVSLAYGDITDRAALETAMAEVDAVFHTAACVELGLVDAALMTQTNVEGTRAVLAALEAVARRRPTPPKLLYCSTIGIYGDTQGRVVNEDFQRQQVGFSSAYDRTKYEAQQLVDQAAQAGLPVVSVLPSGIFGADDPHFGPVLRLFLSGRLKFWPGGDRLTGIVHVDDLVRGMLLAGERGQPGAHYILSSGDCSLREMFAILSDATGIAPPRDIPEPVVRLAGNLLEVIGRLFNWNPPLSRERVHYLYDRCVRVDSSKARRELGWQPRSVEATLRDIISQLQAESGHPPDRQSDRPHP